MRDHLNLFSLSFVCYKVITLFGLPFVCCVVKSNGEVTNLLVNYNFIFIIVISLLLSFSFILSFSLSLSVFVILNSLSLCYVYVHVCVRLIYILMAALFVFPFRSLANRRGLESKRKLALMFSILSLLLSYMSRDLSNNV